MEITTAVMRDTSNRRITAQTADAPVETKKQGAKSKEAPKDKKSKTDKTDKTE